MMCKYFLDTNAYSLFFQNPKTNQYDNLLKEIHEKRQILFSISEITSLEIHSVLGKYRRGVQAQRQSCERNISIPGGTVRCSNIWVTRCVKRLKPKVYRDMKKMVSDIEAKKGFIQADVISLNTSSIEIGTNLLIKYADRYNFGSHDALIIGSFIDARINGGENITIVTSDKGMKAVLEDESLPYFDPK